MDIGAFGKGKGKQGKGKHGKGKGKGKQGQQGQHGQDKDKSKDKSKDSVECWNCGKRGLYSKDCFVVWCLFVQQCTFLSAICILCGTTLSHDRLGMPMEALLDPGRYSFKKAYVEEWVFLVNAQKSTNVCA